jgi:hypothetical protein
MGRALRAYFLLLVLIGCGGGTLGTAPVGFINQTRHSDAELWTIWQAAQQSLAQQIDLNPLQQTLSGAPPDLRPGDSRARHVEPHQILVAAVPDVAASVLLVDTGVARTDPTGLIPCPPPCNVRFAPAYSFYAQPRTKYAASWDAQSGNFSLILQYEFENHILHALGYSTQWR